MVEISIDQLKEFAAAYEEFKKSFGDSGDLDKAKSAFHGMDSVLSRINEQVLSGSAGLGIFNSALEKISFSDFSENLNKVVEKFGTFSEKINVSTDNIKKLATEAGAFFALGSGRLSLSDGLKDMGDKAQGASADMNSMYNRISAVAPELVKKFGDVGEGIQKAFGQVNAIKNLETSLLMNAASAGNLDSAMGSIGGEMSNLSEMTLEYSRLTMEAGTANNVTAGTAAKYAAQLMKIPGAISQVVENVDGAGTNMNMLDATMKVAAGTFQDFKDVMSDVELLFLNFNKTGGDSLTFVSKLHSAAQTLKMPMDLMRGYVHEVGKQFKFLGDNTLGAIDIMSRFAPAFKKSGLGPEAIQQIVGNMTGAIGKMDVAQRAFVSAQTGGPGGLQGGYQISQQMAEGDVAGVFGKVEDTLKGMFGGQIVTLKQASEDARSAAQFTKQVQMLTQGPLAIAESEGEAFKILEALSTGDMKSFGDIQDEMSPENAMKQSMERGNDIQDRQYTELVEINNQLAHFGTLAADVAAAGARRFIGSGSDELQERRERVRGKRDSYSEDAAERRFHEKETLEGRQDELNSLGAKAKEFGKNALEGVKGLMGFMGGEEKSADQGLSESAFRERPPSFLDPAPEARLPDGRVARDMETAAKTQEEESYRQKRDRRSGRDLGKESTLIVQVRSDQEIKKVVKLLIDEDGNISQGKVVQGL